MVFVGEVINKNILRIIKSEKKISYDELKDKYLTPKELGVIKGNSASFDSALETLEKEGYIKIKENIIEFVG